MLRQNFDSKYRIIMPIGTLGDGAESNFFIKDNHSVQNQKKKFKYSIISLLGNESTSDER